jgi:hypothetical protein
LLIDYNLLLFSILHRHINYNDGVPVVPSGAQSVECIHERACGFLEYCRRRGVWFKRVRLRPFMLAHFEPVFMIAAYIFSLLWFWLLIVIWLYICSLWPFMTRIREIWRRMNFHHVLIYIGSENFRTAYLWNLILFNLTISILTTRRRIQRVALIASMSILTIFTYLSRLLINSLIFGSVI